MKKTFALLLVLATAFTLFACNGNKTDSEVLAEKMKNGSNDNSTTPLVLDGTLSEVNWKFDEELSDDFNSNELDNRKWMPIPFSWSGKWCWKAENVSVENGCVGLRAKYDTSNLIDMNPKGWIIKNIYDGDSENAVFVSDKYGAKSGKFALTFGYFFPTWARTYQIISGLSDNEKYTFSVYIRRYGDCEIARMFCCGADYTEVPMLEGETAQLADIPESEDFIKYTIENISPVNGKCKIGFEFKSSPYAVAVVDNVSFTKAGSENKNLAENPDFEEINPVFYSSGGIIGRQTIKYGYMETRAMASPVLPGACSAIWTLGRNEDWGTEIDVLEVGQTKHKKELDFAAHIWKYPNTPSENIENMHLSAGIWGNQNRFNPSKEFHIYGLEWGPGYQKFYVDGKLRGCFYGNCSGRVTEQSKASTLWESIQNEASDMQNKIPQSLLVSLGLRDYVRDGRVTDFDTVFYVDYIRFWHSDNAEVKGNIREIVTNGGRLDVPNDISKEEIIRRLPKTVSVIAGDDEGEIPDLHNQRDVPIIWNTESFTDSDISKGKCIKIYGELELPDGITNSGNSVPDITVYVN